MLSAEERQRLYPPTSKLEEDLSAFFQADSVYEWARYVEQRKCRPNEATTRGREIRFISDSSIHTFVGLAQPGRKVD